MNADRDLVVEWDKGINLNGEAVRDALSSAIPDVAADLLEVAAAVHAHDRRVPRAGEKRDPYGIKWRREMNLTVPVREPGRWMLFPVREALKKLLDWLTDDNWNIQFALAPDGVGPLSERQGYLFSSIPKNPKVVLFSGGLDSTAGLVTSAYDSGDELVAVSVATNNRMKSTQQGIISRITPFAPQSITLLQYGLQTRGNPPENTQRSRGFLFMAAATSAAWTVDRDSATVYENGIGAWNLPYTRAQYGSRATKSMHPFTLRLMEDFVSKLHGKPFSLLCPNLYSTKAQVLARCPASSYDALSCAVSCDSGFSSRVAGVSACGICTSCLLRRQSTLAAGMSTLDRNISYQWDVVEQLGKNRGRELSAMLWQVARFENALSQSQAWSAFVDEFPEVIDFSDSFKMVKVGRLMSMYETYCSEWRKAAKCLNIDIERWRRWRNGNRHQA